MKNLTLLATAALWFVPISANAQEAADQTKEIEELQKKLKLLEAQTDLAKARVDRANVLLEQIPQFEDKTTTDKDTGSFEATVIGARAIERIATAIANDIQNSSIGEDTKVLLLTDTENYTFGSAYNLATEMKAIQGAMPPAIGQTRRCLTPENALLPAVISTVAGAVRSETTFTTLQLTSINARLLVDGVAAKLNAVKKFSAYTLSGSPGLMIMGEKCSSTFEEKSILRMFGWLQASKIEAINLASMENSKDKKAKLLAWAKSVDAFVDRATKPGKDSPAPLVSAIIAQEVELGLTKVVRVGVLSGKGSLTNSKNLATFVGLDPLRISSGVAAMTLTYAKSDGSLAWRPTSQKLYQCTSSPVRLRRALSAELGCSFDLDNQNNDANT